VPDLSGRVAQAFDAAGFRAGVTEPFRSDLVAVQPAVLGVADLYGSPLADLTAGLLVRLDDRTAAVTQLRGLHDAQAVRTIVESVDGGHFLDQRALTNDLFAQFRWQTLRQIAVGCFLVLGVLGVRYRSWRPAVAAFLPSVLVSTLVLSLAALKDQPVNLLHAISLAMVMGMGVDYGIFLVDASRTAEPIGVTALSLLLSCLTTVLVFGMLMLSSNPALAAIGWTTGLGVLLSMLFAPVSLVLLERRE
jgi:predicted exporter